MKIQNQRRKKEKMRIEEFTEKVRDAVEKELGNGYRVEAKEVRKNNGVILHGLMVLEEGQNVAPTIYLDTFLEAYGSGATFMSVLNRLLDICRMEAEKKGIDMEFFRLFEEVRDRICYRLIRKEGNEGLLEDMPYIGVLDLAICFYYAYHSEALGDGTVAYGTMGHLHSRAVRAGEAQHEEALPMDVPIHGRGAARDGGTGCRNGGRGRAGCIPAGGADEGPEQYQEDRWGCVHPISGSAREPGP